MPFTLIDPALLEKAGNASSKYLAKNRFMLFHLTWTALRPDRYTHDSGILNDDVVTAVLNHAGNAADMGK